MSLIRPPSVIPGPQEFYRRNYNNTSTQHNYPTMSTEHHNDQGTAEGPSQAAKMFVGGLPQSVTSGQSKNACVCWMSPLSSTDSLREYFLRFGSVQEAFVLMDETSGRSRGFGFVTFDSPQTLRQVLSSRPHILDNKQVDCKHAVLKGQTAKDQAKVDHRQHQQPDMSMQQQQQQPMSNAWAQAASMPPQLKVMAPPVSMDPFGFAPPPMQNVPDRNVGGGQSHSSSANGSSATGDHVGGDGLYDDEQDFFLTGGGKSYLALSGDKWLEDCAEADERKIFVGGLPDVTPGTWESWQARLNPVFAAEFASFFEHFGPVADAMVMFDRKRRRQRGMAPRTMK